MLFGRFVNVDIEIFTMMSKQEFSQDYWYKYARIVGINMIYVIFDQSNRENPQKWRHFGIKELVSFHETNVLSRL